MRADLLSCLRWSFRNPPFVPLLVCLLMYRLSSCDYRSSSLLVFSFLTSPFYYLYLPNYILTSFFVGYRRNTVMAPCYHRNPSVTLYQDFFGRDFLGRMRSSLFCHPPFPLCISALLTAMRRFGSGFFHILVLTLLFPS